MAISLSVRVGIACSGTSSVFCSGRRSTSVQAITSRVQGTVGTKGMSKGGGRRTIKPPGHLIRIVLDPAAVDELRAKSRQRGCRETRSLRGARLAIGGVGAV